MNRTEVKRDNQPSKDVSRRWPLKEKQPYYLLEKRFTDQEGKNYLGFRIFNFKFYFIVLLPYQSSIHDPERLDGVKHPYIVHIMKTIYQLRGYNYSLSELVWNQDYPVYFRSYNGFILDNRRQKVITCEEYDQDPMTNNLAVISGWGTGMGLSYEGEWGTVTNRCEFGSYRGEKNSKGDYPEIIRKSVSDFPEHGE